MDWDDLKFFLALVRMGSIRAAAKDLGVNNATVSRRIRSFEERIGSRLFDRLADGYALTAAGEALIDSAERIEREVFEIQRRIVGQDAKLSGEVKFSATHGFVLKLLMPAFARFMQQYPDVTLEVDMSYATVNLSAREADIALRVSKSPPEHLVGRKIARFAKAAYATPAYLDQHDVSVDQGSARWIGWNDHVPFPEWVRKSAFPHIPVFGRFSSDMSQVEAAKLGVGISMLPCFIGDRESELVRVPPGEVSVSHDLWLLTHKDLLSTARIRTFWDHLVEELKGWRSLLEGRVPSGPTHQTLLDD